MILSICYYLKQTTTTFKMTLSFQTKKWWWEINIHKNYNINKFGVKTAMLDQFTLILSLDGLEVHYFFTFFHILLFKDGKK